MDLHELRLGNYVYVFDKQTAIVSAIGHDCWVELLEPDEMQSYSHNTQSNDINPIPLTEEWIVKFGLKQTWSYGTYTIFGFADNMNIKFSNGVIYIEQYSEGEEPLEHIKYVHQLQNLYFALTGQELELKKD